MNNANFLGRRDNLILKTQRYILLSDGHPVIFLHFYHKTYIYDFIFLTF